MLLKMFVVKTFSYVFVYYHDEIIKRKTAKFSISVRLLIHFVIKG